MTTHFISDLHLSENNSQLLQKFHMYINDIAPACDRLFILGDFFEGWIGDDYQPEWINNISSDLKKLSSTCEIYFCHGNRDFLLGKNFAERSGMSLLPEQSVITVDNISLLISHGDEYCTDDIAYQNFKQQVRQNAWQQQFLAQSIEHRLALLSNYRDQSKAATKNKNESIMDVNVEQVEQSFLSFKVNYILHGHTHRPQTHTHKNGIRMVLPDWREHGFYSYLQNGKLITKTV